MDGIKQENYALLHDDSDMEEFDKNKVDHIKNQQGKLYLRRSNTLFSWTQPQWLCHTVFIVFLVSSQAALCIFVLTIYADLESVKLDQSPSQKGLHNHINNINGSRFENTTNGDEGVKNQELHPDSRGMDMFNILKKIHTLEMNAKSIKKVVSSHEEDLKVVQEQQQTETKKYENALERQFNNITRALNSLQNRLEENLDSANSQISQLREDVYFIENSLNNTKQERLGEIGTTQRETRKRITMQMTSDPFFTTAPTWLVSNMKKEEMADDRTTSFQIYQRADATMQQISKQNEKTEVMYPLSIPFLKRRTDFQVFFYGADKDANGYLTYDEIKRVLGEEAPNEDALVQFDDDDNKMYSYTELLRILQLRD
ncbi:EF-hand calcium-binding domain-containing protein 14-like [Spea bombifrons]|uniref:EF-hand calcium-binding domain-containing protein 14-like n=1 Tax=Spea bombifrons TaxID=233779 RepID=UPI0023490E13|nr:EF-hand calcium-binding domain-containing protein 14-like [Spea bombifrons]